MSRTVEHSIKSRERNHLAPQPNGHVKQNGPIARSVSHKSPETSPSSNPPTVRSVLRIWTPILLLVFGGCCSNVYTLESLIEAAPFSGSLITAVQFLITTVLTLPSHLSLRRGWRNLYLLPRSIPLSKWLVYTAFFLCVNILNNTAFGYRISVPLHIILRSGGPVSTMLVSSIFARRKYPWLKIAAVALLFVGVVLAAISDAYSKNPQSFSVDISSSSSQPLISRLASLECPAALKEQLPGFALVASALFLAAFHGLYTDDLYSTYGRSLQITSETLFYSHALSLPYFAWQYPTLRSEFVSLTNASPTLLTTTMPYLSPSLAIFGPSSTPIPLPVIKFLSLIPTAIILLLANATTQYICISGVNRLAAQSSSLTVTVVLNIRKLVSLLLSIWLFGNKLPLGVIVGATIVFLGGALYAVPTGKVDASQANGRIEGKDIDKKNR